jgi:hypothetical protein
MLGPKMLTNDGARHAGANLTMARCGATTTAGGGAMQAR